MKVSLMLMSIATLAISMNFEPFWSETSAGMALAVLPERYFADDVRNTCKVIYNMLLSGDSININAALEILDADKTGIEAYFLEHYAGETLVSELDSISTNESLSSLYSRFRDFLCKSILLKPDRKEFRRFQDKCMHVIREHYEVLAEKDGSWILRDAILEKDFSQTLKKNWGSILHSEIPVKSCERNFFVSLAGAGTIVSITSHNRFLRLEPWMIRWALLDTFEQPALNISLDWIIKKMRILLLNLSLASEGSDNWQYSLGANSQTSTVERKTQQSAKSFATKALSFQFQRLDGGCYFESLKPALTVLADMKSDQWYAHFFKALAENLIFMPSEVAKNDQYEYLKLDLLTVLHRHNHEASLLKALFTNMVINRDNLRSYPPVMLMPTLAIISNKVPMALDLLKELVLNDASLVHALSSTRNLELPIELELSFLRKRLRVERLYKVNNEFRKCAASECPIFYGHFVFYSRTVCEDLCNKWNRLDNAKYFKTLGESKLQVPNLQTIACFAYGGVEFRVPLKTITLSPLIGIRPATELPFEFFMQPVPIDIILTRYYVGENREISKKLLLQHVLPVLQERPMSLSNVSDAAFASAIYGSSYINVIADALEYARQNPSNPQPAMIKD